MEHNDAGMEDHVIMTLFRQENKQEEAFTMLVKKYQERLYWHIRRMVVEHEDANDILQNVFLKTWKHLHSFKEESGLFTWLYRIATNEALSWLARMKKRRSVSLDDGTNPVAERLTEQKGFDAGKLEWRLQQGIQALPEKQRIVFSLRYYDEMPYDKMAEVLQTSAGALKASYHHAVKKLEHFLLNQ